MNKPKKVTSWRVCPECGGRATKIFNLNAEDRPYSCQQCGANYNPPGPKLCAECDIFPADPPSSVCPGCEAYREHRA